jgi:hypothetical protein
MSVIKSGRVLSNQPRAVRVREPETQDEPHSAIHAGINILVDSQLEAQRILKAWPEITDALASKITEVLEREAPPAAAATDIEESPST